jgi:mannosyltransferase OCH1-like enzyme
VLLPRGRYDALETGVQRSDMWRYTVLYLHGGAYADVDMEAHPPIVDLIHAMAEQQAS